MRTVLSFDDVLLQPKGSDINSRKEISLTCRLDDREYFTGNYEKFNLTYGLPIIGAPMDTVTENEMACTLSSLGCPSIIHRYNTVQEQAELFRKSLSFDVGCAIGVKGDFKERAQVLYAEGCRIFCIDVAHGFHSLVRGAIEYLRKAFGDYIHIMAGNIATSQACECLANWGADSVKIGIGGGSICSTRIMTGHGIPTFQAVKDIAENWRTVKGKNIIKIADGGIKNSGDIVKALAAGADFVMLGSLLAGTKESPGEVIEEFDNPPPMDPKSPGRFLLSQPQRRYKLYRGMASPEAQKAWNGDVNSREGVSTRIPYKGSVIDVINNLEKGIRSGLSYSGARTIRELQATKEFIIQTAAGKAESGTHILNAGGQLT